MRDEGAALKAFLAQRAALVRYAESILGNSAEAEDAVQEAWLRFSAIAADRSLAEPLGYIRMTVRNLALDGRRRQRLEGRLFKPNAEVEATEVPSDSPNGSVVSAFGFGGQATGA